jgi:hypothetical protein
MLAGAASRHKKGDEMRALRSTWWMGWVAIAVIGLAGCGGGETATEEAEHAGEDPAVAGLEPRHGGRIVELDGEYDAELVIMEGGMAFVYLYDADGNPVPYEGKEVWLKVATPSGKMQELELEGMGTGAGAHFMNPLDEDMLKQVLDEGEYSADIAVETESGAQTGKIVVGL